MAKKIRIGIFGAGAMARKHLESYGGMKNAAIAGVSGARPESLRKLESDFGVKPYNNPGDLLCGIDAADICLPTFLHESAALAAVEAGVSVLCEKPIALDTRAARKMVSAAEKRGAILMIAHCLRFWPEYVMLHDAVKSGRCGRPLSFHGWRYNCLPGRSSRNWLLDDNKSGGPAVDLHIHDADMIHFLFGRPEKVRASEITTGLVRSVGSEFIYPGGFTASADAGWYFPKTYPFSMGYRAVFEKAVFEYHSINPRPLVVHRPGKEPLYPELKKTDGYREELRYFVKCVSERCKPCLSSAEDALVSLRMVLAAKCSAASGRETRI
jgi:predicted dehydrogenase